MSRSHVSKALRARVAEQAKHRCGYCLCADHITGSPLEIDHIIPEASGGPTEEDNPWLACNECNKPKADRMWTTDPDSGEVVRQFDPRHQPWSEHFAWNSAGDLILGLTPIRPATVTALKLNRQGLVRARRGWAKVGGHLPGDN